MKCPKCKKEMKNLGNISGIYYTSNPVQWDETWVCDKCKIKHLEREHGQLPPDFSYTENYEKV